MIGACSQKKEAMLLHLMHFGHNNTSKAHENDKNNEVDQMASCLCNNDGRIVVQMICYS